MKKAIAYVVLAPFIIFSAPAALLDWCVRQIHPDRPDYEKPFPWQPWKAFD